MDVGDAGEYLVGAVEIGGGGLEIAGAEFDGAERAEEKGVGGAGVDGGLCVFAGLLEFVLLHLCEQTVGGGRRGDLRGGEFSADEGGLSGESEG